MELDKAINCRHSVRNFKKTKKPDYRQIITAVEAATKVPLAGNHPSLRYILVQDREKIKKLAEAAVQDFIKEASFVVVVCSDKKFLEKSYYERGKTYSRQQAGASIQNLLLKLTDLGLSGNWIGAFSNETVKNLLKIPEDIDIEALIPIGYELDKEKQKPKPDLDIVLFFDEWKNKYMKKRAIISGSKT